MHLRISTVVSENILPEGGGWVIDEVRVLP